jgi:oligopeptide transport system substrate-binding protein
MVSSAEAKDDKTLVVTLAYPCSYLPSVLAFPSAYPVRQDLVEKNGEAYATDPEKAVYNGAYELAKWTHQESMVMKAREAYYDYAAIGVKELTWELMSNQSTRLASYKSGDIIYSDTYPDEEAASLVGNGLHFTSGYNSYCIMFNVSDSGPEVLKDKKVRAALSLAVDRKRIIDIRGLEDEIATSFAPSGLKNKKGEEFNSTITKWFDADQYEKNCEEAKQLLSDAGYTKGKGFPVLTYMVNNDDRKEIAEAVVNDWKEVLGIDSVTVEVSEGFFAQRKNMDYDIAYFGWYMDYPDISNILYTMTSNNNDAGYTSEVYDNAYNAAMADAEEAAQWEYYAECEKVLSEDSPIAPLLHAQSSYLFDDTNYDGLVYYCGNFYFGFITKK